MRTLENAMNTDEHQIIPEALAWIDDGSTTPEALLRVIDPDDSELLLVSTDGVIQVEISGTAPRAPIHIVLGTYEYTDEDIRQWAQGVPSYSTWHRALLIEYLSQIIVSQVLGEATQ